MNPEEPQVHRPCSADKNMRKATSVVAQDGRVLGGRTPVLVRRGDAGGYPACVEPQGRLPRVEDRVWPVAKPLGAVDGPRVASVRIHESPGVSVGHEREVGVLGAKDDGRNGQRQRAEAQRKSRLDGAREPATCPDRTVVGPVREGGIEPDAHGRSHHIESDPAAWQGGPGEVIVTRPRVDGITWEQPIQLARREAADRPRIERHQADQLQVAKIGLELAAREHLAAAAGERHLLLSPERSGERAGERGSGKKALRHPHGPTLERVSSAVHLSARFAMHRRWVVTVIAAMALSVPPLGAQAGRWQPLVLVGSDPDDRARLAQLRGLEATSGYLLRSASTMATPLPGDTARLRWALVLPEYTAIYNSALPFSLNDGAMWAGRGWNQETRTGLRAAWKRVSLTLAPELLVSENLAYELPQPGRRLPLPPGRDSLSSPWHIGPASIDLPLRYGVQGFVHADPGQSTLSIDWGGGALTTGFTTENEWRGPGIHNALVLSNNAPGIPRLFVRTGRPIRTHVGSFEARWFLGGLFESPYFDQTTGDDRRSITALAVTWMPAGVPGLRLGFTRAVYAPWAGWQHVLR